MYDEEPQPREKKVETTMVIKDDYLGGTVIYEEIIDPKTRKAFFIDHMGIKHKEVYKDGITYVPIPATDDAFTQGAVKLPTGTMDYGTTKDLIKEIQEHIHKYLEIDTRHEKIASWYILFTHIYDLVNVVPYLRVRGDTGTGKNRYQDVIGGISYKPMFTAGAITPAIMYRNINRFKGTLIIDEADWYKSDATSEIIKILNCGFQRGRTVMRCQKDNPDNIQYFDTYCPKILSTRKDFKDKATENRCITHINREMTRIDIPINLPREFYQEQETLRNKCLTWRLDHYNKIDPDLARTFKLGEHLSPRLRQVMENFPLLFHDDPEMMTFFKETLQDLNTEMKEERAISYDGMIANTIFALLDDGYTDITPGDIATEMKKRYELDHVTPQSIGIHTKTLGFNKPVQRKIQGENKRCLDLDPDLIKQLRRRYQIDMGDTSREASRLDDWGDTWDPPSTGETVPSVPSVPSVTGTRGDLSDKSNHTTNNGIDSQVPYIHGTVGTVGTPKGCKRVTVPASITLEDKNNGGNNGGETTSRDPVSQRLAFHDAIRRLGTPGKGLHLDPLRRDKWFMSHFKNDAEVYRVMDKLLSDPQGGIYEPRSGWLDLA